MREHAKGVVENITSVLLAI